MKRRLLFFVLMSLLMALPLVMAQETAGGLIEPVSTEEVDPSANISFPPPVYLVRDTVEIRGTVNVASMRNFFVEFRPLVIEEPTDTLETPAPRPWFPATLPQTTPVIDNVLGTWNTFTAPDGLYELRLTINTTAGTPIFVRVSPIRVQNNIPPFLQDVPGQAIATQIPTQIAPSTRPTLAPTPTALNSGTPMVTALVDANVRSGDTTEYDRVGFLFAGESAQIVGVSSFNTNWYYIQLSNGRRGFIAPSVVETSGNLSNIPPVNPPPPPTPPATATPVPTATPITSANLIISNVTLDPSRPRCNETYTVTVTVKNTGTSATLASGTVAVQDNRQADGQLIEQTFGAFPPLQPNQSFDSVMKLTVSTYYNENHNVNIMIDSTGAIPETNENDNFLTAVYDLRRGDC